MSEMPGAFYSKLCRRLGSSGYSPERERRLETEISRLSARVRELEARADFGKLSGSADRRTLRELEAARERLAGLERIRDQKDFGRAMRITGMGLRPGQVVRFSAVAAGLAVLAAFPAAFLVCRLLEMGGAMSLAVSAGIGLGFGLAVFILAVSYPERLAKGLETEAFGAAPEAVNYMAMSMELSPSLDRAAEFAAANATGPMAEELKALVWSVKARRCATTEEALMAYADELRGSNEELASALYSIMGAARDSEREKARSVLRRACDGVLAGTRQRVEGFAASLGTPATVLFSLGILLPMIIGSMLPMVSMGGFSMDIDRPAEAAEGSWVPVLVLSVLMMDIGFPLVAFAYAGSILSRRPGVHSVDAVEAAAGMNRKVAATGIIAASAAAAFLISGHVGFWGLGPVLGALAFVMGIAAGAWALLDPGKGDAGLKEAEALEDQIPDMLFQLGSRLGAGQSLERAVAEASGALSGTDAGRFLAAALSRMRRSGESLSEALFSETGLATRHPSGKLRASMRLAVEASSKDPEAAGAMLMAMSNHMRELASADREMRIKLRSTVDSMRNTAILFAPVIMGVTVGLYGLLSDTFADMSGANPMPTHVFALVIGIYLLATVSTIMHFCSGIEQGRGRWRRDVAQALPVSAMIFFAAALGSLMAFG